MKSDSIKIDNEVNYYKLASFVAITGSLFYFSQKSQNDLYWKTKSDFHIMPWSGEYPDALMSDKFGHFFASQSLGKITRNALLWSGVDSLNSAWGGFGIALFHQSIIEIKDGYHSGEPYLGFSRGDMIANTLGSSIVLLNYYFPESNNLNFKIGFINNASSSKNYSDITTDYESTYHWWSYELGDQISKNTNYNQYLKYFNLAIGHSVKGLDRNGAGNHEIYLGMDLNLKQIDSGVDEINKILEIIDLYKLPLPALRVYPNIRLFLIR